MGNFWLCGCFFVFNQKTAYELRISDWSSDVCSSDLAGFDGYGNLAKIDEQVRDDVVVLLGGRFDCQLELVGVGLRHVHVHEAKAALGSVELHRSRDLDLVWR